MVGVPMLRHEKTLCSNPKLFVLKRGWYRFSVPFSLGCKG